jgi:hypothetical protein
MRKKDYYKGKISVNVGLVKKENKNRKNTGPSYQDNLKIERYLF